MKLWIAIVLMLGVLFVANWFLYTQPYVATVTQAEADHIISELRARRAGNCVVVRTDYGFRAEALDGSGKVYKVKR
jgi:uncharacterized protein YaiI (UPF0178 family)